MRTPSPPPAQPSAIHRARTSSSSRGGARRRNLRTVPERRRKASRERPQTYSKRLMSASPLITAAREVTCDIFPRSQLPNLSTPEPTYPGVSAVCVNIICSCVNCTCTLSLHMCLSRRPTFLPFPNPLVARPHDRWCVDRTSHSSCVMRRRALADAHAHPTAGGHTSPARAEKSTLRRSTEP